MFYLALIIFKLISLSLSLLPRFLFVRAGRALGSFLRIAGFRAKIVTGNLDLAYPELPPAEREKLERESFSEFGVLALEIFRMFYRFDRMVLSQCDIEGREHLQKAIDGKKGVFVMTAHLGNWELLTTIGPLFFHTPVTMVTKELKPAWLQRVFVITRSLLGVKMACEPRTMPEIIRTLKKAHIVGFVMDQYAGAPVGARVPFFGKPVGSHTALATLALRTGAPVVPAIAVRKPNGRYLVRFDPPFQLENRPEPEASLIANTALFVRHTETWVREFPAQWLWVHRRWKGDLSPLPPQVEGEMLR